MRRHARRLAWLFSRILVVLALAVPLPGAAEDDQQQGIALIARAQALEKLLAPDTGPFRLRAHVRLLGLVGGTSEGEYVVTAASSGRWFEQTSFPGYSELSGLYDGERWRKRSIVDRPLRLSEAVQLLSPAHHLELPSDARISHLAEKEIAGTKAACIQASPTAALWQKDRMGRAAMSPVEISRDTEVTLCFEAGSGLLLSATYQTDLPRFEYEGQVAFGGKVFPRVLRCYEGRDLVVEATVEELVQVEVQDPAGYAPPAGAARWPDCASPDPPQLLEKKRVEKRYNERILIYSKVRRQYGTVYCLAEVGTDGHIHDFTWLGSPSGGPAVAAREAVKAWTYRPAACGGVPVPMTIYIAYTMPP